MSWNHKRKINMSSLGLQTNYGSNKRTHQPTTSNRRNQGIASVWPSIEETIKEVWMDVELSRDGALRAWEFNFIFVWKILVTVHINEFLFR